MVILHWMATRLCPTLQEVPGGTHVWAYCVHGVAILFLQVLTLPAGPSHCFSFGSSSLKLFTAKLIPRHVSTLKLDVV